jgi:hypothetical protein
MQRSKEEDRCAILRAAFSLHALHSALSLLALFGHAGGRDECPFLEEDRKLAILVLASEMAGPDNEGESGTCLAALPHDDQNRRGKPW